MGTNPHGGPLARLLRQPLLHFLVLGAALGAPYVWLDGSGPRPEDRTIRIDSAEIDRLKAEWQARWSRPPTAEELDGLIRGRIRETALYREAVAMGLDRDDPVIRRLLVQRLEGMAQDLVELSLVPTDQDLEAYFAKNLDRYRPAPAITFAQVFVDPERRGESALEEAARMLEELRSLDNPREDAERFGDPFMLERFFVQEDEARVASLFGREFARSLFELPAGRWQGPVPSGYGTHLVHVEEVFEFPAPALADVMDRVTRDWLDESRNEITEKYFAGLLARYEVIVEGQPGEGTVEAATLPAP